MAESTVATTGPAAEVASEPGAVSKFNPRTGEELYSFVEPDAQEIADVFARARQAHQTVSHTPLRDRLSMLNKMKHYMLDNKEHIIDRLVDECGKSRMDALLTEIMPILDLIDYYEKNAAKYLGEQKVRTPLVLFPKKSRVFFEPIGVVLIIAPWNFPLNLALLPIVTAFCAGNAIVFKPSEWTPLKGLIEEIVENSGFPRDAVQIVYGGKDAGRRLIDERPAKILFTGSTRAGKQIMKQAADYLIPVELELGGKDPMVVFDDASLERTVDGAIWGGMMNCGQVCTSVERILVQEGLYDRFLEVLARKMANLKHAGNCGDAPDRGGQDVGCMTTGFQMEIVEAQIRDAVDKGARIVFGGNRLEGKHTIEPTALADITDDMEIAYEETFGPVITIRKFKTDEEAIAMANDTIYGLSASVWSSDIERAKRVGHAIETGNVSINNVLATQANSELPFGGYKQSGFGRYKGHYGLHNFCNIKSVLICQGKKDELHWYPYSEKKYQLFMKLFDTLFSDKFLALYRAFPIAQRLEWIAKREKL